MSDFRERVSPTGDTQIDPTVISNAKERMGTSRARLLLQQPFYGVLLSMTDFTPETVIPTMATDGARVYYNPEFVMSLSEDEVYGVLLHEISHCIYLHCTPKRRLNRDAKRWNVACDFAINLEIKKMGYTLPEGVLLDNKYEGMNAEQIYDDLPKDVSKFQTLDMHIEAADEKSWDDMEDKIVTAYEMTANTKGKGDLPGGLKRWIDKIRKNKVRWERIFHKYVGQALAKDDYSFTRINKRYLAQDIYLPDLRNYVIGEVVVAIDTSGSIGRNYLEQFAGEINKIRHLVTQVTAISCDCRVQEVVKVDKFGDFLSQLKMSGGGGTDMRPVFERVAKDRIRPELLIYLTDAFGTFPEKAPPYNVLWCCTDEAGMSYLPHYGQRVLIPSEGRNY